MQNLRVLAISTTWPPMSAGSGRAFKELISGVPNLVALVPRTSLPVQDAPWVRRVLRFSGHAGGPLKIYTILQHSEAILAPLVWTIFWQWGRPDLVICNLTLFAGVGGLLLNRLWGVPFIVHGHGEEFTVALRDNSFFHARRYLTKLVLEHAAAVICNARSTLRVLRDEYGVSVDRLHVIHPTVETDEQYDVDPCQVTECKKALLGDCKMILMGGRLSQQRKGFDMAIEALPLIRARVPDATLVIAGPGDQTALRSLAQKVGAPEDVIFVGEVERRQLMQLYAACDVFLLPTRTMPSGDMEGFGIVFLEANLMGKPVVGGRSGGTEDAVIDGQTGLLVEGNDICQIAEAVSRLLCDSTYADLLGRQGRKRVLQEFNGRVQKQQFVEIVNNVISNRTR